MKDKVFFDKHTAQYNYEQRNADDICYLRKEAMLEWAKETYLNESASAIRKVCYKQLIDKLNSL